MGGKKEFALLCFCIFGRPNFFLLFFSNATHISSFSFIISETSLQCGHINMGGGSIVFLVLTLNAPGKKIKTGYPKLDFREFDQEEG